MYPKKEWFSTYEPFEEGTVQRKNEAACTKVGIGSIRMKMFDGLVRTLKDARYVPSLRKIFLSFRALKA